MGKDEWRITSGAIEMEMERIAGLLQKSIQFQSRTPKAHTASTPQGDQAALQNEGRKSAVTR